MTCCAMCLTNLELLRMVWDLIMDYSAKFQLKIPYYFRVIDVFLYDPPFYMTHHAIRGGGLTNLELLGIAGDKIMG